MWGAVPGVKSAGVWEGGIFEGKPKGGGMPEGNSKLAPEGLLMYPKRHQQECR